MRKAFVSIFAAAILLLSVCITPAAAASPNLDVSIVITTYFTENELPSGPFVASGPAVVAGLICSTGVAADLQSMPSGWQSFRATNYHLDKQFTCDDDSGTFILHMEARIDPRKGDTANWNVVGSTGEYAALHGSGKLYGVFFEDSIGSGVIDNLTGRLH